MSERVPRLALLACAVVVLVLAGCGQKGPLYLPDQTGKIVTRPTQTPPPADGQGPNTPQSVDSPQGPDNPAPEVTKPEDEDGAQKKPDDKPPQP